MTIVFKMLKFC